jgi:integrase
MSNSKIVKYIHINKGGVSVDTPNLYVDLKTGIFLVRVYHNGRTQSRSLGTKSYLVAKNKISSAIQSILQNKGKKKDNKLVRDYYQELIELKKSEQLSERTIAIYENCWKNHIGPFWENFTPSEIDSEAFKSFLVWHKKKRGFLLFNPLKLLKALVAMMLEDGSLLVPIKIYAPKWELDDRKQSKGTYVTDSEIKKILKSAKDERINLMIDLSYSFGFRIGEVTNLRREAVKDINGLIQIHLSIKDTKTRRARIVPLNERLSQRLRDFMKKTTGPYVFPMARDNLRPMAKQTTDRLWLRALKDSGIKRRIRFHDLRHTCATNFADMEINETKACAVLGMSLTIYSSVYVKRSSLDLNSVIDAVTLGEKSND